MRQTLLFVVCGLAMISFGCKEKQIEIPELSSGNHRVLVEEVTGVRCNNCPDGTRELTSLQAQYGDSNLIVVSIHAADGILSVPYTNAPVNKYDFRTQEGFDLTNYIEGLSAVPTASIDRFIPSLQTSSFVDRPWAGVIATEFAKDHGLDLFVNNSFNSSTRTLDIQINIAPAISLSGEHRLTLLITQDSIVDTQLDGATRNANYIHRHVLRDVVTQVSGDVISESLIANGLVTKNYQVQIPAEWEAKHCHVVAFVHNGGNPDKLVLQATEKAIE